MRFRLLGPLEVLDGDTWRRLPSNKLRSLLACLLLNADAVVSTGHLIEELWEQDAPRAATNLVQQYVMRLRRTLDDGRHRIVTRSGGYELVLSDRHDLDSARFADLVAEGTETLRSGRPVEAAEALARALDLWRGPALADVPPTAATAAEAARLGEQRTTALELRVAADLACGRHTGLVAELRKLVAEHPFRERLWGQLMLALYRCGRQADALAAYHDLRRLLRTELSVEPGADLAGLHRRILDNDPELAAADPPADPPGVCEHPRESHDRTPPRQLPADLPTFAGRADELRRLTGLLDADDATAVVISVIAGAAGIGKTALAVHAAHRLADRFPDGQLYLNLRGFDAREQALDPAQAVRALLDTLGVPPERIPPGVDAQAALYRSLLAGRRMLLLLDNARNADQVRPLLPGTPGCLALVTSRDQLSSLVVVDGARPLTLDLLPARDARALLADRLGSARVEAAGDAVTELVALCAHLPLALAVVAARAASHPSFPLAALARELRTARTRLDAFASPDPTLDVRSVFSWSYRTLSGDAARLFRLLSLHPGPDVAVPAAASLAGLAATQVRPLLAELTAAHLLTEHGPGRYTYHDLLGSYAAELAEATDSATEREAATRRLLDHYLHTTHAASLHLHAHRHRRVRPGPPAPGVTRPELTSEQEAQAWLAAERPVLLALVRHAAGAGFHRHVCQLAALLEPFLGWRGYWHDWDTVQQLALTASRRLGDRAAQAHVHRSVGHLHARMTRYAEAHRHYRRALTLFSAVGDVDGQASALLSLGILLDRQRQHGAALTHLRQSLSMFASIEHKAGQADALNGIGWALTSLGDYRRALSHCEQALTLHRELADGRGLAATLDSIGFVHHHLARHGSAVSCFEQSLNILRRLGDRYREATVLTHLGDTHRAAGATHAARRTWRQALRIFDTLDHPDAAAARRRLRSLPDPAPPAGGAAALPQPG